MPKIAITDYTFPDLSPEEAISYHSQQYGNCGPNEYDMPQAGTALWLTAEQAKKQ
jgi:hypothetical protein